VSLAIGIDSDAWALALPGAAAPTAVGVAASTGAGAAGSTGAATSISVSGRGPASAAATSGDVGGAFADPQRTTYAGQLAGADVPGVVGDSQSFLTRLLTVNGVSGSAAVAVPALSAAAGATADVEVATLVTCGGAACPAGSVSPGACALSPGGLHVAVAAGQTCSVAVAVSIGGSAHAGVLAPPPTARPAAAGCTGGRAGAVTAIAVGVRGPARAAAQVGAAPMCSGTTAPAVRSGSTGDALGVALSGDGVALSTATSGNSGAVRTAVDAGSFADPVTGDTGDAVGIAIARHGTTALVASGDSGTADAVCTNCGGAAAPAGGTAIAIATSGPTGISYSLAIAGLTASVRSQSGNSGRSIAWTIQGAPPQSGAPSPSGSGTALVDGRSGKTGDTVVVAIGLNAWIEVWNHTGDSGPVTSLSAWGARGCTFDLATLVPQCVHSVPPPPGMPSAPVSQPSGSGQHPAQTASRPAMGPRAVPLPAGTEFVLLHIGAAGTAAGTGGSGASVLVDLHPQADAGKPIDSAEFAERTAFVAAAHTVADPHTARQTPLLRLIIGISALLVTLLAITTRFGRRRTPRRPRSG
jgi:hypothetical protein